MSTPQDPRDSGRTPEDGTERPDQASGERSSDTPGEPIIDPSSPQPLDKSQTSGHVPQPPESGAPAAEPQQAPTEPGPTDWAQPAGGGTDDPPTEYLPKLLQRDSGGSGATAADSTPQGAPADDQPTHTMPAVPESGASGQEPPLDKGSAAFTHGWQPGTARPGGEVPPQAWSSRPEEQAPGQAWQPQQPGYPPGGTSQRPPEQSGWPGDQGAAPGAQPGWGAPTSGQPDPGHGGWGNDPDAGGTTSGQAPWGAGPAWAQQGGQPGWGGQPQQPPGGYPAYPQQPYQPYGATRPPPTSGPQVLSIIGFICAAVALFFCPILFGPAGIVLGVIGHIRGETLGKWAAIAAAACLVLGFVLGILISGGGDMVAQAPR